METIKCYIDAQTSLFLLRELLRAPVWRVMSLILHCPWFVHHSPLHSRLLNPQPSSVRLDPSCKAQLPLDSAHRAQLVSIPQLCLPLLVCSSLVATTRRVWGQVHIHHAHLLSHKELPTVRPIHSLVEVRVFIIFFCVDILRIKKNFDFL